MASLLVPGLLEAAAAGPPAAAPPAVHAAQDRPAHEHQYVRSTRKVWVPPVTKQVVAGRDSKGNPIYKTKVVRPGYYKTVTEYRCRCGASR